MSKIASVRYASDPAALDNRTLNFYDDCSNASLPAKKGGNTCDWTRMNIETEPQTVVIGCEDSSHTLPGEV